ncbi:MAG: membrane protein insertase YidC [Muribaculaceae bacterium]
MDKNTLTGLLLIGLVFVGFTVCQRPPQDAAKNDKNKVTQVTEKKNAAAEVTPVGTDSASIAAAEAQLVAKHGALAPFVKGEGRQLTVKGKNLQVTFDSKGGRITKVVLPGYKTDTTTPPADVTIFGGNHDGGYSFTFETATQRYNTADLNFEMSQPDAKTVVMSLPMGESSFEIVYTINDADYLVTMDMRQKNMERIIPGNRTTMRMNWSQNLGRNETGRTFEERNSALYYKFDGEDAEDMSANEDKKEEVNGALRWVAFKNQFFSSVVIARDRFTGAELDSKVLKSASELKKFDMNAVFNYSSAKANPAQFTFFFGPNSYPLLSDLDDKIDKAYAAEGEENVDLDLNSLVNVGWGIFGWINRWCVIPLFQFLGSFIGNYGLIIILITLIVKLVLFPFTYKSYKSQAKMRVLAPEIKEINEKYPGQENAAKRSQETMALYSRTGASPFSGCLPMLLQMPVLIAMFSFFPTAIELRGQSFLWAHDLSAPDYIFTLPFSIPILGNHLSLFCLLMTVVNIIYTYINMQNQPSTGSMPGMKWMMYLMPLMFLFFFNDYAAGLSLYYFVFLLVTILQTVIFRLCTNEEKVRAQLLENARKPRKKSGFMARLEEAQKKQEAYLRAQQKQQAKRRR